MKWLNTASSGVSVSVAAVRNKPQISVLIVKCSRKCLTYVTRQGLQVGICGAAPHFLFWDMGWRGCCLLECVFLTTGKRVSEADAWDAFWSFCFILLTFHLLNRANGQLSYQLCSHPVRRDMVQANHMAARKTVCSFYNPYTVDLLSRVWMLCS